jgi:hypothetical protein
MYVAFLIVLGFGADFHAFGTSYARSAGPFGASCGFAFALAGVAAVEVDAAEAVAVGSGLVSGAGSGLGLEHAATRSAQAARRSTVFISPHLPRPLFASIIP